MANDLPAVEVSVFTQIVKMAFLEENHRPIFGVGKGGIGKTESIRDLAVDDLKVGYIDVRLLMYSEVDLKGIPYPDETHTKTIWLQNNILPREDRDGAKGILVFDEITSAVRSVRTAAYQLLNERKLGEYVLPEGWLIVCLGNGEEDGGDYQGMEGNFANRCSIFNVVASVGSFKEWAFQHNVNSLVTAYISWKQEDLHTYSEKDDTTMLFASPRSWKAVSDILNKNEFDDNNVILRARILSNLGLLVGGRFCAFCAFKSELIDTQDILDGKPVKATKNSEVLFMTMQTVVKMVADEAGSCIKNTGSVSPVCIRHCANVVTWILSLSRLDQQAMGIKDMIAHNPSLFAQIIMGPDFNMQCPGFREFAAKNSSIFRPQK